MDAGFDTIGNATLICYDKGPVLVTDPWLVGGAYFQSWALSHRIPEEQLEAARHAKYVWISHGHPDHLSGPSLDLLRDKKLLLPDHVGGRIFQDLKAQGFDVHVMRDRAWVELSPRIRAMSIPDYNQDAVLLVDLNGRLVVNLNDSGARGSTRLIRSLTSRAKVSYLMALSGFGDADMINFFTEDGLRISPHPPERTPVGQTIARMTELFGARFFVPFSSMHQYQRSDSLWANAYTTGLDDYPKGFESKYCSLLPAFVRCDCVTDHIEPLHPAPSEVAVIEPKKAGDDWDERLEPEEVDLVRSYFKSITTLEGRLDFIDVKVGGRSHRVELPPTKLRRGITFEVPRTSLVSAIRFEVFDDLLIGNFMKTTLHGDWGRGPRKLHPDFTPYVAKYADNGRAKTPEQLKRYFEQYRERDLSGYLLHQAGQILVPIHEHSAKLLRAALRPDSNAYRLAKDLYWRVRQSL